jgi:putative DNA primase/helicase
MALDFSKLEKVRTANGKTIARCPACAEADEDRDGKHLAIFADGRFACVTHQGDKEHRRRIWELAGLPDDEAPPPRAAESAPKKPAENVDWPVNCDRLAKDEAALARLAAWRGWSADYCRELALAGVMGLRESRVCFPVTDAQGVVIGRHVFQWPELGGIKAWYAPGKNMPLVIGAASLAGVRACNVIESQWDALALLHVRGWHGEALEKPFLVTRGTSISPALQTMLAGMETVLLWMQHDEPKAEGKAPPAEEWLARCMALMPDTVREMKRVNVAAGFKDWNDALRDRGPVETLALVKAAARDAVPLARPALPPPASVPVAEVLHESAPPPAPDELPLPQPLPSSLKPVMTFNDAWMPESFRPWLADLAERMQCPPDFPAVAVIVALASVIGRRVAMQPKEFDTGWIEHCNLWGLVVGDPGSLKSPTLQAALRSLRRMEAESVRKHQEAEQGRKAELMKAKLMREAAAKKAAQAIRKGQKDEIEDIDFAGLANAGDEEESPLRRFIVNDFTLEALGEVLRSNPFGTLAYQDELAGLFAMLQREGNQSLQKFLLTAWNGNQGFTFDRIMRGVRQVDHACLSVLGGIQPGVLAELVRGAQAGGAAEDGLIQRFQLMVWPDSRPDWRDVDKPPHLTGADDVEEIFRALESQTPEMLGKHVPLNSDGVPVFTFAPDAQERFRDWRGTLENRLRHDDLTRPMIGHLSKYRKLVPALALVIHLAEWRTEAVTLAALEKALHWAAYLETHAARVYASRGIVEAEAARSLLKKLRAGTAGLGDEFTARQVRNKGWSGMSTPEEADAACELLADCAWLLRRDAGRTAKGGRPTTSYRLNPRGAVS